MPPNQTNGNRRVWLGDISALKPCVYYSIYLC